MANQKEQNLKLNIAPEVARGTYSNLAVISHSPSEITLGFTRGYKCHDALTAAAFPLADHAPILRRSYPRGMAA